MRYFYHDGSGVKEVAIANDKSSGKTNDKSNSGSGDSTASTFKDGKYTVIIAPADSENYKGGESFVMNVSADVVTFAGNDAQAPKRPGIVTFTSTQQDYNADGNKVGFKVSNEATGKDEYNAPVVSAGRYMADVSAEGVDKTSGILSVYKVEAAHYYPFAEDKTYDGAAVSPKVVDGENVEVTAVDTTLPAGYYFTYTGGEIVGISYDAPKDAGTYTVTLHVPATDRTVAYSETSTFKISKKDITVSAAAVTKQLYRTNPELRYTVDGLVAGDSDHKDFIALASMSLKTSTGANPDLNDVGDYTISPSGVISRNYNVAVYNDANFAVQDGDPAVNMEITGLPNGQVYYGDTFRVSLYGTVAQRVDGTGVYNNSSSVIEWLVSEDGMTWTTDTGNVKISEDGVVSVNGAAAKSFTIKALRGTGEYKTVVTTNVDVKKRPVYISMIGEDTYVFDDTVKSANSKYYTSNDDAVKLEDSNLQIDGSAKNVGEYKVIASYDDGKYVAAGKGMLTITKAPAVVISSDSKENVYGTLDAIANNAFTVEGQKGSADVLIMEDNAGNTAKELATRSNVRANSDVGKYEIFTAGVESDNYDVSYKTGKYEVVAKALTVKAGVDDLTNINAVTRQIEREYGKVNPQMGYQTEGFIAGDSLADLAIDKNFVVYERKQEDDANRSGAANAAGRAYVNGHDANDDYGKIDLYDGTANINANAKNYDVITLTDGLLDIYQKNIEVIEQNLTVKKGTELKNDSYFSEVKRVLTEAPMNDKLADLGITYTPVGKAGEGDALDDAAITATLKTGTADDPQNYYDVYTGDGVLSVKDKEAKAVITPDADSVTVETSDKNVPVNEFILVYAKDASDPANVKFNDSGVYVKRADVENVTPNPTEDKDNNVYLDIAENLQLYDADGNAIAADTLDPSAAQNVTVEASRILKEVYGEVKTELVNVGDIDYIVLDANRNKAASGTMQQPAGKENIGKYADDPYEEISGGLSKLPNGTYTIILNPTASQSGEYALSPTVKEFEVGKETPTPTPSKPDPKPDPKPNPEPDPDPSPLIKDDHFAYMKGNPSGNFRPNDNLTRAEAATVFYNLLVDKSMGSQTASFTDVDDNMWYATAINTLASKGIINGYADGTYHPEKNVTRAEFAAIASRFDSLSTGSVSFKDVDESHWAYDYIISAATKKWITGYEDGTFHPDSNITRAEVVVLVNRVLERTPDETFISANASKLVKFNDVTTAHWAYANIVEATNAHDYYIDDSGVEHWDKLR